MQKMGEHNGSTRVPISHIALFKKYVEKLSKKPTGREGFTNYVEMRLLIQTSDRSNVSCDGR